MRDLLLETYFQARPGVPRELRLALRRYLARRSLRFLSRSWPINQLAGSVPEWWTGWPDNKKFAFVVTHDAEGQKGLARCRQLAELELSLGFRSSFNFVPEGEYATPTALREFLVGSGFEVGVHDLHHDGKLYSSEKNFRRHTQKINRYLREWGAVGFRSAFMLHKFAWLAHLDILYDSSSFDNDPFEPQPEGVNTIFPFCVDRVHGPAYVELPYTLPQDSTLFLLLRQSGIDIWIQKLEWVAQRGGLALVNVHPDYLSFGQLGRSSEYPAQLYQNFLEFVRKRYGDQAWFALPEQVAMHVRNVRATSREDMKGLAARRQGQPMIGQAYTQMPPAGFSCEEGIFRQVASNDWQLCGKRVAMVTFSFYPGDPRPRRAAEALVAKGMRVDLICLAETGADIRHEVVNGIDIFRVPMKRRRGSMFTYAYQYSAFLLISSAMIAARSLARAYDMIYVHNMPDFLVLCALLPKLFGAKVVLDLHDPMPELMTTIFGFHPDTVSVRLLKWVEHRSIALADSVVTVNRACAKLFTSRGCPSEKMNVVMNAPDERIFDLRPPRTTWADEAKSVRPFVMMYHGSLVERNGLDLAVEALAQVRQSIPSAQLRIYGTATPFLERVMKSVADMGLQDSAHYIGPKSLEQLVAVIEECDVGIIPNRQSVFAELNTPTRIFEYLALGKPVIAPRAPGICDYFNEDSLIFFELGNAADLAAKIKYAFAHPPEVAEITTRGQQIYEQHKWSSERRRLTELVWELLTAQSRVDAIPVAQSSD